MAGWRAWCLPKECESASESKNQSPQIMDRTDPSRPMVRRENGEGQVKVPRPSQWPVAEIETGTW